MILENFFAVNETSMSPRSPAMAMPRAPRAPAAPTLEEEDQSIDPELVNQIYQNNQDVIGRDPNLIKPGQVLSLPDGSSYAVQRGDSLSKIAKKIQTPAVAVSGQVPAGLGTLNPDRDEMGVANWKDPNPPRNDPALVGAAAGKIPNKQPVTPTGSSVFDVFPDVGGKLYDLLHPPAVNAAPVPATIPPVPAAKTPPAPVAASRSTKPAANASPEMVPAADSMDPGEEIVTGKKPKPPVAQPKRVVTPTPQQPNVIQRIEKGAEEKAGQVGNWLAGLVRKHESGDDFDKGFHYAPGSGTAGPDKRKTTAWGAYGLTNAAILDARRADATLQKPLKDWTPEDQTRAFNINVGNNLTRMNQLGVDLGKHPEAPAVAIFLGADGAAKYYNTGKFNQDTLDANGGKEGVKAIIAQRTKSALAAIEQQKKQRVKETVNTVNTMLETASTADDVRHIRNYIDRQYTRHGLLDQVAFAQRNHLIERVIEITDQRQLLAR
jgi:LysM repeat protein